MAIGAVPALLSGSTWFITMTNGGKAVTDPPVLTVLLEPLMGDSSSIAHAAKS